MPVSQPVAVKKLKLDLENYRTTKQADERQAVEAIIAINPDWFWALVESLLDSGYLPTENMLVLESGGVRVKMIVREGNRRLAALKLIHGLIASDTLPVPSNIADRIANVSAAWKKANLTVPCVVYEQAEVDVVNRIRSLTHGKGERAGRDAWTPVARARHNRDENKSSEPALDVLERWLATGTNFSTDQRKRWAGDYRLTVLEEAMKRIAPRLGLSSSPELARAYPKIKHRKPFDAILLDIGLQKVSFEALRSRDVAAEYGIPPLPGAGSAPSGTPGTSFAAPSDRARPGGAAPGASSPGTAAGSTAALTRKIAAVATHDPRHVARSLRSFVPKGKNREKLVSLLEEARRLKLDKNPLAFCFLLRSMFEVSAKVYCSEQSIPTSKGGKDLTLLETLKATVQHLTKNGTDLPKKKLLHGPITELAKPEGLLSVTSMNQLVHNPKFSVQPGDIAVLFGNVFPLLQEMSA
jgi:hypothetical protein